MNDHRRFITRKELADILSISPRQLTKCEKKLGLHRARVKKPGFPNWDKKKVLRILNVPDESQRGLDLLKIC